MPIVTIATIVFSVMNEAVDSGARFQGKVLGCSRLGKGLGLRQCTIDIGNSKEIHVRTQRAKPGDVVTVLQCYSVTVLQCYSVTVSKMITKITGTVFYVIRDQGL
jgi:predicted SPOUT superfamily RNA methylase MTH1